MQETGRMIGFPNQKYWKAILAVFGAGTHKYRLLYDIASNTCNFGTYLSTGKLM